MEDYNPLVARVRQNVLPAAVAAGLLTYYGFSVLAEPSGAGLFERAALVFYHTLRIGGVAMAVIAVLSMAGVGVALLLDAIVSTCIGLLLALTGIAMFIDGGSGLQPILNVLFGAMFVSAGVRSGRDFRILRGDLGQSRQSANSPSERYHAPTARPPTGGSSSTSLAGHLRQHRASHATAPPPDKGTFSASAPKTFGRSLESFDDTAAIEPSSAPSSAEFDRSGVEPSGAHAIDEGAPSEPIPVDDAVDDDGFLASFGQQDPPAPP